MAFFPRFSSLCIRIGVSLPTFFAQLKQNMFLSKNSLHLTQMGSERSSIAWSEWERWHFHEKISKVPPPKMVPPPSTFPLEPFSSKLVFLTGLEKSSSIWLFSSNEWALGRAMHEMSYFPRKFPPQLSCCCCPKGWLQALPRIRIRGGGHLTHTRIQKG